MQGKPFDLSREALDSLTDRFSDQQIADQHGVAMSTINQLRKRLSVESRYAKTSCRVNRSTQEVLLPGEGTPHLKDLDSGYFKEITTECQAYFLGLLITDGHIENTGKGCFAAIELQEPDCIVIERFAQELNSTKPLERLTRAGKKDSGRIRAYSRAIVADLQLHGMTYDTERNTAPTDLKKSLRRHFLRGVFDGDGHIDGKSKSLYLGSCSSALCESVAEWVREEFPNPSAHLTRRKLPSGKIFYRLSFSSAGPVVRWLYEDCEVSIPRKKEQAAIWLS